MSASTPNIVVALEEILGSANVIAELEEMAAYLIERRKRFHAPALAVARPRSVGDVQRLLAWANDAGVPLIPQGGNTGLVGGQVPLSGREVIVSLTHLDAVREVDAAAGHMTVEAGLSLQAAQEAAEGAGALFPLSIASQGTAEIGGVLSTNAGGVQVLAYGNARDLCLGVEAVLADGRLYSGLNALKKNNTGYDLKDLLVGAEGTLGIITAATLKLYPRPEGFETAMVSVQSPDRALELFYAARERAGQTLTAFELLPRFGVDIQLRHAMIGRDPTAGPSPWYALVEISRPREGRHGVLNDLLEEALEKETITNAVPAESLSARETMWKLREQMSESQSREGGSIKHDVSVPVQLVPRLIAEGSAAAQDVAPGIRPCPFGHLGDGNIHFNFSQPEGADREHFMAEFDEPVHEAVYEVVARLGGSISAEHGIGQLKTVLLEKVKDPVALEMMRAIKSALDPKGILNPGKVLR